MQFNNSYIFNAYRLNNGVPFIWHECLNICANRWSCLDSSQILEIGRNNFSQRTSPEKRLFIKMICTTIMFLNLLEKWSDLAREEEEIFVVFKHLLSRRIINSSLEYVIQVSDIADCQSKYLDFRELLVRRQRRQQLPQFRKCQVERLHPDSFPDEINIICFSLPTEWKNSKGID